MWFRFIGNQSPDKLEQQFLTNRGEFGIFTESAFMNHINRLISQVAWGDTEGLWYP